MRVGLVRRLRGHGDRSFFPSQNSAPPIFKLCIEATIHPNHAQINQYGPINQSIVNSISARYRVEAGYNFLTPFMTIWYISTR